MKKLDNFSNSLNILTKADKKLIEEDELYRMGIIGQFSLTFELAWKALQAVLRLHGIEGSRTGSPLEILKLAYKVGFINDEDLWLNMLKKRNTAVHEYNEDKITEITTIVFDDFIPAFEKLRSTLAEKIAEAAAETESNTDENYQ